MHKKRLLWQLYPAHLLITLAMLAGVLEINPELYEAGALDGITNRFQEA